mgnify:CR=1 FL=1
MNERNEIIQKENEKWARFLYKLYTKEKTKERKDPSYKSKILDLSRNRGSRSDNN